MNIGIYRWLCLLFIGLGFEAQAAFSDPKTWADRAGRKMTAEFLGYDGKGGLVFEKSNERVVTVPFAKMSDESLFEARRMEVEYMVGLVQKGLPKVVLGLLVGVVLLALALFIAGRMLRSEYTFWTAIQAAGYLAVVGVLGLITYMVGLSISHKIVVGVAAVVFLITPFIVVGKMYGVPAGGAVVHTLIALVLIAIVCFGGFVVLKDNDLLIGAIHAFKGMTLSLYV